jgi:hypothetical protein
MSRDRSITPPGWKPEDERSSVIIEERGGRTDWQIFGREPVLRAVVWQPDLVGHWDWVDRELDAAVSSLRSEIRNNLTRNDATAAEFLRAVHEVRMAIWAKELRQKERWAATLWPNSTSHDEMVHGLRRLWNLGAPPAFEYGEMENIA